MVGALESPGVSQGALTAQSVAPAGAFSIVTFTRHFFSMCLAMMVGCVITCGILLAALDLDLSVFLNGVWFGIIVTVAMAFTMDLWMVYRMHHSRRSTMEMTAAMFIPLAVFIGPYSAGWIPGAGFCTTICVAMVPAMLGLMVYRRDEYGMRHGSHHMIEAPITAGGAARTSEAAAHEDEPWH